MAKSTRSQQKDVQEEAEVEVGELMSQTTLKQLRQEMSE